ncbi:MAG: hypothetical protein IKI18_06730 [Prevotella sp.]|nr:hypothetical protein [Prevotella sp.]
MDRVQKILMTAFWIGVVLSVATALAGELNWIPVGAFQGNAEMEFVVLTAMELLTLAMIPLALRLFKFKKVKQELHEKREQALLKWGICRLDMLHFPLFLNVALYYFFANNSFGIMALILCCCLVFVYPSKSRCRAELEV